MKLLDRTVDFRIKLPFGWQAGYTKQPLYPVSYGYLLHSTLLVLSVSNCLFPTVLGVQVGIWIHILSSAAAFSHLSYAWWPLFTQGRSQEFSCYYFSRDIGFEGIFTQSCFTSTSEGRTQLIPQCLVFNMPNKPNHGSFLQSVVFQHILPKLTTHIYSISVYSLNKLFLMITNTL